MLKIENIKTTDLKHYKDNAKKHPQEQIDQIKQSIQEFGFNDPIAIDEENIVIEGNGRLISALQLELEKVPCIRLVGLTAEQKRAYVLVHNKLTMNSDFDLDILAGELSKITEYDMSDYGFNLEEIADELLEDLGDINEGGYFGDERERTYNAYNLDEYDPERASGFYQLPELKAQNATPKDLISFNYLLNSEPKEDCAIHFYIDDYQFERVWNDPYKYIEKLKEYKCVLTPDFSLYMDMPMAMKIWNIYRSRLIGQIFQDKGLTVIPTLQWAEAETLDFAFNGIGQGGTVSVSTIGVKRDENAKKIWYNGMDEAIKQIKPKQILVYGGDIGYEFPEGIKVKYYDTKAFKE